MTFNNYSLYRCSKNIVATMNVFKKNSKRGQMLLGLHETKSGTVELFNG